MNDFLGVNSFLTDRKSKRIKWPGWEKLQAARTWGFLPTAHCLAKGITASRLQICQGPVPPPRNTLHSSTSSSSLSRPQGWAQCWDPHHWPKRELLISEPHPSPPLPTLARPSSSHSSSPSPCGSDPFRSGPWTGGLSRKALGLLNPNPHCSFLPGKPTCSHILWSIQLQGFHTPPPTGPSGLWSKTVKG